MLGLSSSLISGAAALKSVVRSGLQLFYKADRTQAPLGEEQVRNNSFDELGPDKIDNGNFETGIDGWDPNTGSETTITYNSQLKGIKFSNYGLVSPTVRNFNSDTVTGETYKLTYKVLENNNASKISIWNGNTYGVYNDLPVNVSDDEHVYYYTFSGGDAPDLYIKLETDESDITLSNIKLEKVDPNNRWTLGTGWVFSDNGTITHTGSTGNFESSRQLVTGKKYEATVVVDSIADASCNLFNSSNNETYDFTITTAGTHVRQFTATHATSKIALRTASTNLVVSSFSVKEITNSIKDHSRNSNDGILYSGKALDFDGGNDLVELNNANLPGEFTVCTWIKPDTFDHCVVFGDDANQNWIRLQSPTSITIKLAGASTDYVNLVHGGNIAQDEWSRLIVTRGSDDIIRFGINGIFYSPTDTTRGGNFNFHLLGRKQGTEMNGALADVQVYDKAWNATDVKYDWENPDKDVFHRVGEAQVLGEELIDNGYFSDNAAGWSPFTNANLAIDDQRLAITPTTSSSSRATQGFTTQIGKTYIVNADFDNPNSSTVLIGLSPNSNGSGATYDTSTQSSGSISVLYTATTTTTYVSLSRLVNDTKTIYYDNVSVKEITTHASHILPTDCKSLLRLNEGAGDRVYDAAPVLGEDLMESRNGSFELGEELNDLSWLSNVGWSTDGDVASNNGDGSTLTNQILELGKTYQFKCKLSSYTSGEFSLYLGVDEQSSRFSGTDEFTFTGVCSGDLYARVKSYSGIGSLSISSLTIKEIPNWVEANYLELNDSGVFFNNSNDNIFQNFSYIDGATYAIGFEGSSDTGLIRYRTGFAGISNPKLETPIPGTAIWRPDSTSQRIQLYGPNSGTATVSKVTIKQIKPAESFAIVGDRNFIHQQPYIPQYAMSSFSKKMVFDGVNDYVAGSFNSSIGAAKDITLSCWFSYRDTVVSSSDRETLFGLLFTPTDEFPFRKFEVGLYETNRIVVYTGNGTTASPSSTLSDINSPLSSNKLNHVAVSLSSNGVVKIYVNGVESASNTHSNFGASPIDNYRIGSRRTSGTDSQHNKGIIDEVSLFKTVLTQAEVLELYNSGSSFDSTGHSKYNLGEEVSNGTLDLGSEEVVDGNFATDSDWELRPGWSVNNNTAVYDGTGSQYARIIQTLSTVVDRTYQMAFTLSGLSSGDSVNFGLGHNGAFNGYDQETYFSNGTYTRIMQAQSIDDDIMVQVNQADANCTVSNISVKEIPSWSFGDGWSYVDGKASLVQVGGPQATDYLMQELPGLVDGRTYVVSFDLDITSSTVTTIGISASGAFGNIPNVRFHETSGRKTFTAIYDSSHQSGIKELRFVGGSNTEFTIDNVSVQEYGVSGYWRNNGADQWDDLSINSNHGTVSGSPTEIFLQEVPFFGKDSLGMFMNKPRLGGLNFNGSGYVEIHDTADLDFPAATGVDNVGEFSVECWVRYKFLSQGSTVNCIYSNGEEVNDVNTFSLITNQDNKIGFYVNSTLCSSTSTFSLDEWVHVVGTREHGTNGVKLYINGNTTPEATTTNNNAVTNSFNKRIGWDGHYARYLESVVDDVRVYNRALAPAEIKKNYNTTKGKHKN